MTALNNAGLYLTAEKCKFLKEEVKYLGSIVRVNRIRMDPETVQAVENWKSPEKLKVQAFLGLANFSCQFIQNYSRVVQLLTTDRKRLLPFPGGPDQKRTFVELKAACTAAPMLPQFKDEKKIVLDTHTSSYVSG
jgi:hypothetical protein